MTPKEYVTISFEEWWKQTQGDRMPKSKYLAKKAWKAAFKESVFIQNKINEEIARKYYETN